MQRALTSTPPTRARPPQPPPDDANLPNAAAEVSCHAHHEASTQNPYQRALTLKLRAEFKPIPSEWPKRDTGVDARADYAEHARAVTLPAAPHLSPGSPGSAALAC